ncbi:helix-turn-helix transcriptional regulator [Mycolicibacterium litorale]|uniref:Helix-turn-helix transcriptional regulator n=1 Tax=Mycolicibacterium litorale TaxID=758802 RepID=A0AAD1MSJ5_9MYCO|nr:regulatory LuxR family protein [Mycolicibacterium litorale]BBY15268.1 helix-turn-helix transcriptional regulator [Mycolicibacterium litorale]
MELVGRRDECREIDDLLAAVRSGESRVLVVCGEAGIGKTALLDEAADRATGCRVVRIAGIESEMEFAFSALHRLCATISDQMSRIVAPQRDALCTALGERDGPTPDPFLVGLAVLNLLSEAAQHRGLVLLVDDQQWLDQASSRIMGFVARRLGAESLGIVLATRNFGEDLRDLPTLPLGRLRDDDSRTLLSAVLDGPLDARVRDRIIAEARGNPLALLEVPRTLSSADLAGGFGLPPATFTHSLEGNFRRQIESLPPATRRLLALAAAEPAGDPALLWSAADVLGLDPDVAEPAMDAGLVEIGTRVRFRHPLIRSTAYRCVPLSDRRRIHGALARVTDAAADPDSRAWHLGQAVVGPDEEVAGELERSAGRAQARGGFSAAAAFLERASTLTLDSARRCDLAIAAASAMVQAGQLDRARDLLTAADNAPLSGLQRARVDLVRAQLASIGNHGNDAAPLLLCAARRLETVDAALARETYLDALAAALFAGRLAVDGGVVEVSEAARAVTRGLRSPRACDLLLDGIATLYDDGFGEGLPTVAEALRVYGRGMSPEEELRWMVLACFASARIWDMDRHISLSARFVQLVRDAGAVSHLPLALSCRFLPLLFTGKFDEAARTTEEMRAAIDAMGKNLTPYSEIALTAWRGRHAELEALSAEARLDAHRRGEGHGLTVIAWAKAVAANSRCDYRAAREAAAYAASYRGDGGASWWALTELVEAATRLGETAVASAALDRLAESTTPSGTDWSLGVEARSRAVTSGDDAAESAYVEAVDRLARAGLRPDLGRAHLLYGEWLRRQRRRVDARAQLRAALDLFESIGMEAFAERARRELLATGEKARRRSARPSVAELTAQEVQIARLARDGLSNPEIGARLFISAHTVKYHLGKVFAKLGIRSRSQLDGALRDIHAR